MTRQQEDPNQANGPEQTPETGMGQYWPERIPEDYYKVLGVPYGANDEAINKAFIERGKAVPHENEQGWSEALERAKETLSDKDKRDRYDRDLVARERAARRQQRLESERQQAEQEFRAEELRANIMAGYEAKKGRGAPAAAQGPMGVELPRTRGDKISDALFGDVEGKRKGALPTVVSAIKGIFDRENPNRAAKERREMEGAMRSGEAQFVRNFQVGSKDEYKRLKKIYKKRGRFEGEGGRGFSYKTIGSYDPKTGDFAGEFGIYRVLDKPKRPGRRPRR